MRQTLAFACLLIEAIESASLRTYSKGPGQR